MAHADAEVPHAHHVIPRSTLAKVFGGLIFLTVATVLTSRIDLGAFNVPLALAIALTKAGLVVAFFMALKYDKRVNILVFTVGCLFVVVFLVFTLFDVVFRGDMGNVSKETITDMLREEQALQGEPAPPPQIAPGDTGSGAAADTAAAGGAASPDTSQAGSAPGH